ncbi:transglutaminase family protein [Mobilicoccus pelagius]|uniref:transglutaminase family protein n=1 Tax=Mobilicoccus pelagius TaxID=746032 RepID=UPI00058E6043|nr:transglutaminase domain-containing protein [Mobilicoccus pelagius]
MTATNGSAAASAGRRLPAEAPRGDRIPTPRSVAVSGVDLVARSGVAASALVAVALWASAAPIATQFTSAPWRTPLLLVFVALVLTGSLVRQWSRVATPFVQALVLAGVLTAAFGDGAALFRAVPTPATVERAGALLDDATLTIATSPPPAPGTVGVAFAFAAGLGLLALLTDTLAVTLRRPLLAVVPVVLPALVVVAVSGEPSPWPAFVVPALALVGLLLLEPSPPRRPTPTTIGSPSAGRDARTATRARRVGVTAVVTGGALLLATGGAALLPHHRHPILDHLGGGASRDLAQVGFTPAPDLLTDLRDDDPTPVLRYRTTDPTPPPLRIAVTSEYDGARWLPATAAAVPTTSPTLPYPPGLTVPAAERTLTVTETRLDPPYLAAPAPLVGGTVTGSRWGQDPVTGMLVVDRRPRHYEMTYLAVPRTTADDGGRRTPDLVDELDATTVRPEVWEAAEEATRGARTDRERAEAIEAWLRDEDRFTYSLDLPEPQSVDPIETFLHTRTGYCTHFATTMILLARAQGIPARLATGFLPGTPDGDSRVVRADDAHAWPELYLPGLGWTRFEPTPATRTGATPTGRPTARPRPSATPTSAHPTAAKASPGASTTPSTAPGTPAGSPRPADDLLGRLAAAALVALVLLAALAAPAALASARHRRRLHAASSPAEEIDEHWRRLTAALTDLGLPTVPDATVRANAATYAEDLHDEARAGLDRLVAAVEAGRYRPPVDAPTAETAEAAGRDAESVRAAALAGASRRVRWRARLWPTDAHSSAPSLPRH